jgi:hypothetical protein
MQMGGNMFKSKTPRRRRNNGDDGSDFSVSPAAEKRRRLED